MENLTNLVSFISTSVKASTDFLRSFFQMFFIKNFLPYFDTSAKALPHKLKR